MPPGRTVVASRTLMAIDGKGHEFEITIAVGEPYQVSDTEWACPASMEGLHGHFSGLHGVDTWQALQLAHQIIAQMLVYFVKDGGQLFDPEKRQPVAPEELFPKLALRG
jgi:Domain of unknown function (DUF6968)